MGVRSREESCLSREINQAAKSRNRTDAKIVVEPPRPDRATSNQTKNHDHPTKLKPEPTHTETKPEGDVRTAVETDDRHRNVETENRDRSKKKGRGSRIWTNPLQRRRPSSPDRTRPPTTDYRPEAVLCRAAPPNEPDRAETKIPNQSHPSQSNETAIRLLLRPTDCQTPYPSQRQHARRTCRTHARDESAKRPPHDNLEVTLA